MEAFFELLADIWDFLKVRKNKYLQQKKLKKLGSVLTKRFLGCLVLILFL